MLTVARRSITARMPPTGQTPTRETTGQSPRQDLRPANTTIRYAKLSPDTRQRQNITPRATRRCWPPSPEGAFTDVVPPPRAVIEAGTAKPQCPLADRYHSHAPANHLIHRETSGGRHRKEIIRCLKRHIAREIYHLSTNPPPTPGAHLRCLRQNTPTTLAHAATALQTYPTRLSQLGGIYHNHQLATRYQTHHPPKLQK